MLIDSHCHLDYFQNDFDVVDRARAAGVGTLITIGTRVAQADAVKALALRHESVFGTVGIHPHNAGEAPLPSVEALVALADAPKIVGIGESGLDYFYDKSPREVQQESFRRHIRAARLAGLPLVVHARSADDDIARILHEERDAGGDFAFVLHCFSSGRRLAEAAVAIGGFISLSGILTFPKSDEVRAIARDVPADRLLVETDAPYLAPVPFRGKQCEPAMVVHTAEWLAKVRGWTIAETHARTTGNTLRLFDRLPHAQRSVEVKGSAEIPHPVSLPPRSAGEGTPARHPTRSALCRVRPKASPLPRLEAGEGQDEGFQHLSQVRWQTILP